MGPEGWSSLGDAHNSIYLNQGEVVHLRCSSPCIFILSTQSCNNYRSTKYILKNLNAYISKLKIWSQNLLVLSHRTSMHFKMLHCSVKSKLSTQNFGTFTFCKKQIHNPKLGYFLEIVKYLKHNPNSIETLLLYAFFRLTQFSMKSADLLWWPTKH